MESDHTPPVKLTSNPLWSVTDSETTNPLWEAAASEAPSTSDHSREEQRSSSSGKMAKIPPAWVKPQSAETPPSGLEVELSDKSGQNIKVPLLQGILSSHQSLPDDDDDDVPPPQALLNSSSRHGPRSPGHTPGLATRDSAEWLGETHSSLSMSDDETIVTVSESTVHLTHALAGTGRPSTSGILESAGSGKAPGILESTASDNQVCLLLHDFGQTGGASLLFCV